jgi:hypothetical protein
MSCRSPRRDTQPREQDADVDMRDAGLATGHPSYIVVAQSDRHQPQRPPRASASSARAWSTGRSAEFS